MTRHLHLRTFCVLVLGFACLPLCGSTWYVRTDGGTSLQCTGKANAPYTGGISEQWNASTTYERGHQIVDSNNNLELVTKAGTSAGEYPPAWATGKSGTTSDNGIVWTNQGPLLAHQACAVNNLTWLATMNTPAVQLVPFAWVPKSGDVIQFEDVGPYYIGSAYPNETFGSYWYNCLANGFGCSLPPIPTGVSIWGKNKGACTAQSSRTVLSGVGGAQSVLSLKGSSSIDLECLDITDHSNCTNGIIGAPNHCTAGGAFQSIGRDWAVSGIAINNKAAKVTLTDIRIHGMAGNGLVGAPGDGFVATDLALIGNAFAGWNSDDGSGTTGSGSMLVKNFDISWNGCAEEFPIVDPLPYYGCTDDGTGGYGDGFGTASVNSSPPGWQIHFDQGTVSYNTQDGLDTLHNAGEGSTVTETRILAFGNEGQQIKGGSATSVLQNNLIIGNCDALKQTIPGRPTPTQDNLGDLCRAGSSAVVMLAVPGFTGSFQNNTVVTSGSIGLEVEYGTNNHGPTNALKYNNNIFLGSTNPGAGDNPTPIFSNVDLNMLTSPGASWTNNSYYGWRKDWSCPHRGESKALCSRPGLVDEKPHPYGYGNMAPRSSSSPVVGAGVAIPEITIDYTGAPRGNPPTIGAYEHASTTNVAPSRASENNPGSIHGVSYTSVATGSIGAAALLMGMWTALRYFGQRAPKT